MAKFKSGLEDLISLDRRSLSLRRSAVPAPASSLPTPVASSSSHEKFGSLIKTAQGQLLHPRSRRELPSRSRYSSFRNEDFSGGAARILRSCRLRPEPRHDQSEEAVVSLDESLEKNREYWWIPAENRDQSAVSFALQKMTVVVLSEQGVFAHF